MAFDEDEWEFVRAVLDVYAREGAPVASELSGVARRKIYRWARYYKVRRWANHSEVTDAQYWSSRAYLVHLARSRGGALRKRS